jgi:hypothetical protein
MNNATQLLPADVDGPMMVLQCVEIAANMLHTCVLASAWQLV